MGESRLCREFLFITGKFLNFYVIIENMNRRIIKQIVIALVTLGIFSLIGGGIYLARRPAATCFDGIQNQGEEGIDCGGPCISCDLKYNPPISLAEEPILLINENNKIDVLFKIKNLSEDWGAKSLFYKVIFTGANEEKQQFIKSGFILPHEVRYFLASNLVLGFQPVNAEVEIIKGDIIWEQPPSGINLGLGDPFIASSVRMIKPEPVPGMAYNVYTFTKTLVPGMKDAEVFNLQKVLSLDPSVYPEGEITGYYGKLTEAAVMRFQKKYGIRITGEVGPQTRAKLHELYGPEGSKKFTYTFTLNLKKGDKGDEVLNLQRALLLDSTVAPIGSITGYFDAITEKALEDFQLKHGLSVTGEVEAGTRAKLNELFSDSASLIQLPADQLEAYEASLEVKGDIFNETPYNWRKGEVIIILCDKNKKPISVGATVLENIYSKQTQAFVIRWRKPLPEGVTICEKAVININILNKENAFLTP